MLTDPSPYILLGRHGEDRAELNIVAPEGLVNAQMITGYKDNGSIISVNQGRKEDTARNIQRSKTSRNENDSNQQHRWRHEKM